MSIKVTPVSELQKLIIPKFMLRAVDPETVASYAEAMKAGSVFPPVLVCVNTKSGESFLGDGSHRVVAATEAGIATLQAEFVKYDTLDQALADMLSRNKHGLQVRPQDRDERICLLSKEYAWTQSELAKEFGLSQGSISRILEGKQKAGKATGEAKKRTKFNPLSAKALLTVATRMVKSLEIKSVRADLKELCWSSDGTDKVKKKCADNLDVLKELKDMMVKTFEEMERG